MKKDAERIVMTGASGRLGRMLLAYWPEDAPPLIPLDRASFDLSMSVEEMRAAFESAAPDLILHLAGVTPTGPKPASEADFQALNTAAAIRVMEAAKTPVFLASSASVYGGKHAKVHELSPLDPPSPYAQSKADADRAAEAHRHVTVLRYPTIAGADQLLQNALKAREKNPLRLDRFPDGGAPRRAYIGPRDLAHIHAALAKALLSEQELPPVLNLASPRPVAMDRLLNAFANATGRSIPWVWKPAGDSAIRELAFDTRRLSRFYRFDGSGAGATAIANQAADWFKRDGQLDA
ncbi:NAD-dependent epimerase/dehydratase family protein [Paracoccaceae bacterium GXU_MW_L88]